MLIYTQVLGILRQFLKGNLPHRWKLRIVSPYQEEKPCNSKSMFSYSD